MVAEAEDGGFAILVAVVATLAPALRAWLAGLVVTLRTILARRAIAVLAILTRWTILAWLAGGCGLRTRLDGDCRFGSGAGFAG